MVNRSPVAIECDMGDAAQGAAIFDRIESEVGTVSILVNGAGIALPNDFLETALEEYTSVINVNLVGTFVALQRTAKSMITPGIE